MLPLRYVVKAPFMFRIYDLIYNVKTLEGRTKGVMVLYRELETALKDFATLLADGAQAEKPQNHADGAAPGRFKIAQFFRRLWAKG